MSFNKQQFKRVFCSSFYIRLSISDFKVARFIAVYVYHDIIVSIWINRDGLKS